ncbi:MAG TPA: hypothetical protein VLA05_06705 [Coriobacteriia bacterium]|nr:hypothetical protein [Coriobacteriia bacterium]
MSLRRALDVLPDDRATVSAARQILAFFESHPKEPVDRDRLGRVTGLAPERVDAVMHIFEEAFVIDCAGSMDSWIYTPTTLLGLEVQRYLRSASGSGAKLQQGAERFRNRYGTTR